MSEARQMLREAGGGTIRDESYTALLEQKFQRFLGGVKDPYTRKVMAILFENELRDMQRQLQEDTLAANAGAYTKYIFPVLRRVFPNLIANEVVSVQPMTAPVGAVFYFEYKHGKAKGTTSAGSNLIQNFDRDYTSEKVTDETLAIPDGVAYGGAGTALSVVLQYSPVRPLDASEGYSVTIQDVDADGTVVQEAVDNGSGGFTGDVAAGSINYATGQVTGFLFTAAPAAGAGRKIVATYFYDSEGNRQVPDVFIDIDFETIRARTRKLKARWSAEAADDLRSLHGIDAETELVAGISQEIALELDRDILDQLFAASATTTSTFDFTVPAGISEVDHIRSVLTRMSAVSFLIHKKTLRAPANWFVTSPEVSAKIVQLQTHGDYQPPWLSGMGPAMPGGAAYDGSVVPPSYGPISSHQGIIKLGPVANKWYGYQDPFFRFNQIMLGLRGQSYLDAGFVFSPYVPLQMTPTFLDPEDQTYRKGMRTRYATKLLRSEWYGRVTITGGL